MEQVRDVNLSIERCSAVWIAAVNGDTGGGGCELALACDFRYMADGEFSIAQPEILLGFPPGGGGTQRLTRLLGRRAALRICLDGGPKHRRLTTSRRRLRLESAEFLSAIATAESIDAQEADVRRTTELGGSWSLRDRRCRGAARTRRTPSDDQSHSGGYSCTSGDVLDPGHADIRATTIYADVSRERRSRGESARCAKRVTMRVTSRGRATSGSILRKLGASSSDQTRVGGFESIRRTTATRGN
jgi:hypothetical protein